MAAKTERETLEELKELVVAYAKQETIDPIKGLGRYFGLAVGGAFLLGLGSLSLALAVLRFLQTETGDTFAAGWSWVPYAIVVVAMVGIAIAVFMAGQRRKPR